MTNNPHWGIPDWRDDEAYNCDPLKTASERYFHPVLHAAEADLYRDNLWHWEFLRRLAEYRQDWSNQPEGVRGSEKYGLMYCFPDPREARPVPLWFDEMLGGVTSQSPTARIGFDLAVPLRPQIERATRQLYAARDFLIERGWIAQAGETMERLPDRAKWATILRVLDAREVNATFSEIGTRLLEIESYNDAASAAKKLHNTALRLQATLTRVKQSLDPYYFANKVQR